MGDKIVVLNGGRVEQTGAPLDLYDFPANRFVATFLGSPAMNMIAGRVDGGELGRLTLPDGTTTQIARPPRVCDGKTVIFGVRPENIHLDADQGVACKVTLVEPMGSETHLIARLGETEIVAVLRERLGVREGDVIRLSLAAARAHFFDPSSGERLRDQ